MAKTSGILLDLMVGVQVVIKLFTGPQRPFTSLMLNGNFSNVFLILESLVRLPLPLKYQRSGIVARNAELVVFPKESKDLPSKLFQEKQQMIIILHFGAKLLQNFIGTIKETRIAGLDAQFCNNNLRRPLYVLCTQNPISFTTIPGFVILMAHNDIIHLTRALELVREYLESCSCEFPKFIMINKCQIERSSIKNVGGNALLCEFHVQKLISNKIAQAVGKTRYGMPLIL